MRKHTSDTPIEYCDHCHLRFGSHEPRTRLDGGFANIEGEAVMHERCLAEAEARAHKALTKAAGMTP